MPSCFCMAWSSTRWCKARQPRGLESVVVGVCRAIAVNLLDSYRVVCPSPFAFRDSTVVFCPGLPLVHARSYNGSIRLMVQTRCSEFRVRGKVSKKSARGGSCQAR